MFPADRAGWWDVIMELRWGQRAALRAWLFSLRVIELKSPSSSFQSGSGKLECIFLCTPDCLASGSLFYLSPPCQVHAGLICQCYLESECFQLHCLDIVILKVTTHILYLGVLPLLFTILHLMSKRGMWNVQRWCVLVMGSGRNMLWCLLFSPFCVDGKKKANCQHFMNHSLP